MTRKLIALFALATFCLFNVTCIPIQGQKGEPTTVIKRPDELGHKTSKLKIINVVLKDGRSIDFQKAQPATVSERDYAVVGMIDQELDFAQADIKDLRKDDQGRVFGLETQSGLLYRVRSMSTSEDRVHVSAFGPITIPLSDIQQVWILKPPAKSGTTKFGVYAGVALLAASLILALTHKSHDSWDPDDYTSCPFVYSHDGEGYVLDAEPYGGAITEGLKRTDWIEMSDLRAVDGRFRVLLTNELDETQYTDELKLLAVDHAPGVRIAPDLEGRIHTFDHPLAPKVAFDGQGRDILPFVSGNDKVFWMSNLEKKDPDGEGDFRDELVFEFPKPAGARTAKLLANLWTTQWGSQSSRKFMEFYGSSLPEQYADIDGHGPMYDRFTNWMAMEELYNLKVWVETSGGWKERAMIMGGAPVITKDKAYALDVSDVMGDVLRIKLRPPVNFWMVNSLAVDYGEDAPIQETELAAEKAVDQSGRDVRGELAASDGSYLENPNSGEWTELVFAAPPLRDGLERTVLVKASGYYRAHLEAKGEPQTDRIERLFGVPGFAARYSFREYLSWEAGLRAELAGAKRF